MVSAEYYKWRLQQNKVFWTEWVDPYNLSFTHFLDHWMCKCRIIYAHAQYTIYCYQSITTWKLRYKNLIFQDNTDNSRPIPGFLGWVWTLQGLQSREGSFHYSQTSGNFPKMSQKTHKKGRNKPNLAAVSLLETPWWPSIHISHLIHSDVPILQT